jgi:hypothetical protein
MKNVQKKEWQAPKLQILELRDTEAAKNAAGLDANGHGGRPVAS